MPNGKTSMEERKQKALEAWVNNPTKGYEEIAKIAGIGDKTFWRYRQDEEFMNRYREMCQERFKSLEAKAVSLLDEQLDYKNWNAIKYVLDGLGYKPTDKVEQVSETTIKVSIEDGD